MGEREDIGIKNPKERFSKWFSEVIAKAELADIRYNVKGFVVFREWSVLAMEEMYKLYERELQRRGHKPVWFPAVIPEENFEKEAEHVEGFCPEVFWVTHAGDKKLEKRLALRPTSETAMYSMYSIWVRSWRDLPLKLYQRAQVWRYETKATRPFIRSREFYWLEAHDVFATREEAERQVKEDMEMTETIMHREFGVPFIFMKRPEWDKFAGAVYTFAADSLMPDGKIIQQPSTHLLGQNFSKPFDIKFIDRNEKEEYAWQTCYGPCISRIFASVVALHGDDKGLRFPFKIAPLQVIIIPIGAEKSERVMEFCREVRETLYNADLRVEIDDSKNTPGWKFNQWEMKGVPIRLEIGPKESENNFVTLVRRDTNERKKVSLENLIETVFEEGKKLTENLVKQSDEFFKNNFREAKTWEELEREIKKGGFVRIPFCSTGKDGLACAERIKEELHGDVRGERADKMEEPHGNCVVCGKKANHIVYVGKQY
ncbi:MAG TPA: proline--tRNA ligase [Candidatus Aenigmarchaeota archaeon]|nr:proline--tRNA ligase [Candidatus Aenigmarchaeota archaeon]